jgi:hypothetical protein
LSLVPGVDFEVAFAKGFVVGEEAGGVGEFEIAAAPDADAADVGELEGAVDPSAAGPVGGADVPVGVVVEGDDGDGLVDAAEEDGGEIVEVARTVEDEVGEVGVNRVVEGVDFRAFAVVAELGAPCEEVEGGEAFRGDPGVVEVEVEGGAGGGGYS